MSGDPVIRAEVEVRGTPEEVWRAIATGPGISSWYVPHTVEERAGGTATASFGPGPDMQVAGRVAIWEPPRRVVFDGGEGADGLVFEWSVEPHDAGMCRVRLVNTGFGDGDDANAHYEAMTDGWEMFLLNLKLHLEHFPGQTATAMLPMASWRVPRDEAWTTLTGALGVPAAPMVGDRIETAGAAAPDLAGTVTQVGPHRISLVLDAPEPGTGFVAVEGRGDQVEVSIWSYLYGPTRTETADRDGPRWAQWLENRAPATA